MNLKKRLATENTEITEKTWQVKYHPADFCPLCVLCVLCGKI